MELTLINETITVTPRYIPRESAYVATGPRGSGFGDTAFAAITQYLKLNK